MDVQKKSHGKLLPRVVYRGFSNYQNNLSLQNYTCFYILNSNLYSTPDFFCLLHFRRFLSILLVSQVLVGHHG